MKHIKPDQVLSMQNSNKTIVYQQILDTLSPEDYPQTDDELKDLLWCFEVDTHDLFDDKN